MPSSWSRLQGKAATFVLSHVAQEKGAPGARSALRVDQRRLSSTLSTGTLIQRTVFMISFLLFQCLFVFCGELGVEGKPTRGELVRSTHRVPSPFISSQRFPFETFRVSQHFMGLVAAYGPFLPAGYHPFVLREAG